MLLKNKLIKIISLATLCFSILLCSGCNSKKPVEQTFPEVISELKSYKLEASLQTIFQNGIKECDVIVYFQAPNNYLFFFNNSIC